MQNPSSTHPHDPSKNGSMLHSRADEPLAPILTKSQLAGLLRCSERHVDNLRRRGLMPYINLGRSVRFRRDAVLSAIQKLEGGHAA
jgi:excisionase family DNA binding protein